MTNEAAKNGEPKAESGGHESDISDFKSPLGDLPKTENHPPKTVGFATSDSPLSAFGSPLSVDSDSERIGTTANHPFWSIDRQEYVQAGRLEIGERLQTLSGDVKIVQQKLPRPGPQPVFNLEVHDEHVYFVGEDGVLVHNAKAYVDDALTHSNGHVGSQLGRDGTMVSRSGRSGLAGDHVLPKQAIESAMARAGVAAKSKAGELILGIQDSARNLRLKSQ